MAFRRMLLEHFSPPYGGLMVRSAILWGLGDVAAQAVIHYSTQDKDCQSISLVKKDKEFKINWFRVCTTSLFGLSSYLGPAAYYKCTRKLPRSSTTTAEFVHSTPLDGLLGTVNLVTFFPWTGHFHGRTNSVKQAKEDVKRGFTPALLLGGAALPVALFTNWRFVPAPYQLHFASLFALVGSCYLSWTELELHKDVAGTQRMRKMEEVRFDRTSLRSF